MAFDLYQTVTNQIVGMLEKGVVPWRSPILGRTSAAGHSFNFETGRPYRGINAFLLAVEAQAKGYRSASWMTFRQANGRGGLVRKGERATLVVFWKQIERIDEETGKLSTLPLLRYYNVFNADQIDGIQPPDAIPFTPTDFQPVEEAERVVKGYADAPTIEPADTEAFYRPSTDAVHLPPPSSFKTLEDYYATLFHELAHSTGHSKRLDRKLDTAPQPFGSPDYSREELVAEMAAAFLCGHTGIAPAVIENQAAYLAGWAKTLKGDKRLVIAAAGAAQKAADWIRGERFVVQPEPHDAATTAP